MTKIEWMAGRAGRWARRNHLAETIEILVGLMAAAILLGGTI